MLPEALAWSGDETLRPWVWTVAGFVHIGEETVAPPDRDRPDVASITTWL